MKRAAFLFFVFAACWFQTPSVFAESPNDILVIANAALTAKSVSESEIRDVFLCKKESWSTGLRAIPIHAKDAALRNEFRQRLLHMDHSEETRFWQQYQIKTGKSQPGSFGDTLKAVYKIRGGVSYIYRSQYRQGIVKVLLVLPAT